MTVANMKRLASVIILALFVVMLTACRSQSASPTRILIVGDSITQGKSGDYTWRYFYWKSLTRAGSVVDFVGPDTKLHTDDPQWSDNNYADPNFDQDHEALWGRMAFDAKMEWDARRILWFDLEKDMKTYKPDIIVDMLGHNDFWLMNAMDSKNAQAAAEFLFANQKFIVEQAREVNPNVDFVITKMGHNWKWQAAVDAYNSLLPTLESTSDSKIVLAEAAITNKLLTYDESHPNMAGEMKIAESVRIASKGLDITSAPVVRPPSAKAPKVKRVLRKATATVKWTPVKDETYKMYVKTRGKWTVRQVSGGSANVTLTRREQYVTVQARNKAGVSPKSNTIRLPKKRK